MGSTRLHRPLWVFLLALLPLCVPAEEPAAPEGFSGSDESIAKALAHTAQGLCFSVSSNRIDEAAAALWSAIDENPSSRTPYTLLEDFFRERKDLAGVLAVRLRAARAFGSETDWANVARAAWSAQDTAAADEAESELLARAAAKPPLRRLKTLAGLCRMRLRLGEAARAKALFVRHLETFAEAACPEGPDRMPSMLLRDLAADLSAQPKLPADSRTEFLVDCLDALLSARIRESSLHRAALFAEIASRLDPSCFPKPALLRTRLLEAAIEETPEDPSLSSLQAFLEQESPAAAARLTRPALSAIIGILPSPTERIRYNRRIAQANLALADEDLSAAETNLVAAARSWDSIPGAGPRPSIQYMLEASLHDRRNETNECIRILREGIAANPGNSILKNDLAYTLAEANRDLDEALALADQALASNPDDPAKLDTLAWIFYRLDQFDDALATQKRALAQMKKNPDPEMLDHLGDILAALHRTREAAIYWLQAHRLKPSDAIAAKLRALGIDPPPPAKPPKKRTP